MNTNDSVVDIKTYHRANWSGGNWINGFGYQTCFVKPGHREAHTSARFNGLY